MSYLLEVNDCAFSLYRGEELEYQAPAIAIVQPSQLLFGEPALRQARIYPRQANQQYLARLNADPLPHPVARAANHADLVFLHLQEFISRVSDAGDDLLLAVSGLMSSDQLGVLLGIIQETGVSVCGFVDAATAATAGAAVQAQTHHVDLQLQRACITELAVGEEVQRLGTEEVAEAGLSNLLDSWVNVIADRFVRDTRFDPLHAAETEQQLYNQVYDWVLGPGSETATSPAAEISIDIEHQDHVRHVDVPRSVLEDKAQQRLQRITDVLPHGSHVTLSARCAGLPGLQHALSQAAHPITVLHEQALATACVRYADSIRSSDGQLRLIRRLPHGQDLTPDTASATTEAHAPTHLLDCHTAMARPITTSAATLPLALGVTADGVFLADTDASVLVNGEALSTNRKLSSGDQISHGEARYQLIIVEP